MGHAATLVTVLGASAGSVRARPSGPPRPGDPVRQVDAAVRAVLAELRGNAPPPAESDGQDCLGRLFSLRHAQALPPGTRLLRIGPGTVVTPLARDLLRRQGIAIQLGLSEAVRARSAGEWAFSIAARCEAGTIQALRRALVEDPRPWVELPAGLDAAAAWLQAAAGRGVMLVTDEPELLVWRACRLAGVRAAAAREPSEVHRAARTLGVNLLAVEPAGSSFFWIKQIGLAFRQAGAPRALEDLGVENQRCGSPR